VRLPRLSGKPLGVMNDRVLKLDPKWAPVVLAAPEAGMGWSIASVRLASGESFDHVVIDSGYIVDVPGYARIPFAMEQIVDIRITNDKSRYHTRKI